MKKGVYGYVRISTLWYIKKKRLDFAISVKKECQLKRIKIMEQLQLKEIVEEIYKNKSTTPIEAELSKENFIKKVGNEYLIRCKNFNVYIAEDFWRVSFCIGETPIAELYPKTEFEKFTILEILKKYL